MSIIDQSNAIGDCGYTELFCTEVGSHMWGMNTPESDHDYVHTFIYPTNNILKGFGPPQSLPSKSTTDETGTKVDHQYIELGHLVYLLTKSNCSAIWATTSPIIIKESPIQKELSTIVQATKSSEITHSIAGMASSLIRDANKTTSEKKRNKYLLRANSIINFGISWLSDGVLNYSKPETTDISQINIPEKLEILYETREHSYLPEKQDQTEIRNFLLKTRYDYIDLKNVW